MRGAWLLASCLLWGCGGGSSPVSPSSASLLGTWEGKVDTVTLQAEFTGSPESGDVKLVQSAPVRGASPACHMDFVTSGTFAVNSSNVTITATDAKIRTLGCSGPDQEAPGDLKAAMNYAGALSGPFVLNETQVQLGRAYPPFTRR
jgi:hypothetical protein